MMGIDFKDRSRPFLTVDAVVFNRDLTKVLLIKRGKAPFGYAFPGGHVEYGETLEQACLRELKEETGLEVNEMPVQYYTYSQPDRDPRSHTIDVVFYIILPDNDTPYVVGSDDAAEAGWLSVSEAMELFFAFDHKAILKDVYNHLTQGYVKGVADWRK